MKLYWNAEGVITCLNHAPKPDSEKWTSEDWKPMGEEYQVSDASEVCEVCIALDHAEEETQP
jgi:hypothetical protein